MSAGAEGGTVDTNMPRVGCDGKTGFTPNENIVRSCILRAGCDPTFAPVRNISTCVSYNTQAALLGEKCNLTAKSCADYEACEHAGVAHNDLCGSTPKTGTRCEGDKAINCGNYNGDDRFFDCEALGGKCGTLDYKGVLFADCKLDIAPESCAGTPSSDADYFCHSDPAQDDLRYYCWDGEAYGSSCSSRATCIDSPDTTAEGGAGGATGNARCYFNTTHCTAPTTPTCNNGVATVCSDGALFEYNCGSVGLSCAISSETEHCLAPGCKAADEGKCKESCSDDGSSLTFCYGGVPFTVNCTDYGFTQCLSDADQDGKAFAACRF